MNNNVIGRAISLNGRNPFYTENYIDFTPQFQTVQKALVAVLSINPANASETLFNNKL